MLSLNLLLALMFFSVMFIIINLFKSHFGVQSHNTYIYIQTYKIHQTYETVQLYTS